MANIENLKKGNKKTFFNAENQPSNESKRAGHIKKALLKDISKQLIQGDSRDALEDLAKYLGIDVEAIDIETAMHLKQIERAVKEGDTRAYNAVMDRIKGKPMQAIEVKGGETIRPTIIFAGKQNGD